MKILVLLISVLLGFTLSAQDSAYVRQINNILSSPKLQGRGYVKQGDVKAARFIAGELENMHVSPLGDSYFQEFSFPMNTFPGEMMVKLDNKTLYPVSDYVVAPDCPSVKGTFQLTYLPESIDTCPQVFDSLKALDFSNQIVVAPFKKRSWKEGNPFKSSGWIIPRKSVYWWASTGHSVAETPLILVDDTVLRSKPSKISLTIENKFIESYTSQNVMGMIKGTQFPDSFIVFTAHYDHLGIMGKGSVFRGANDNASGVAAVLSLAKYFSKHSADLRYSLAFIFFGAEESGLLGSINYTEHPAFPLKQISTLINLDMVGSGSEGISIVNGEANPAIVHRIKQINELNSYFSDIRVGGESCNSDHCYFAKAGVPAVFIFTRGPECKEYHNLKDIPENTPFTKISELQQLLIDYVNLKP